MSRLRERYARVAVGYADCGTYGALDDVCARLGVPRLPGTDCYEVFAGAGHLAMLEQPQHFDALVADFVSGPGEA